MEGGFAHNAYQVVGERKGEVLIEVVGQREGSDFGEGIRLCGKDACSLHLNAASRRCFHASEDQKFIVRKVSHSIVKPILSRFDIYYLPLPQFYSVKSDNSFFCTHGAKSVQKSLLDW